MIKIGKKSEEGVFKLYAGVGAFNVLAINPDRNTLSKITGRDIEEEPSYMGETQEGKPYTRVVFWVKTDPTAKVNNGINLTTSFSFLLQGEARKGSQSGKIQIIDKYGRTAWGTEEEVRNKVIPVYSNGKKANISSDFRPACIGEEELVKFVIAWLNIPNPRAYNRETKEWYDKPDLEESECSLNIGALLKGDVKELSSLVPSVAPYAVKVAIGVRTTDEGRQYQAFYNRMFLRNGVSDYSGLDADIKAAKDRGSFSTTEFSTQPLHEYVVEPTDLSDPIAETAENPWDNWSK